MGKRIQTYRETAGLSVAELARAIGVPASTYREWEYGRAIRGEAYLPLAEKLGISLYELLSGNPPAHSEWIRELEEIEQKLAKIRKKLSAQA